MKYKIISAAIAILVVAAIITVIAQSQFVVSEKNETKETVKSLVMSKPSDSNFATAAKSEPAMPADSKMQTASMSKPQLPEPSMTPAKVSMASMENEKFDGVKIERSDVEWRKTLSPKQFEILRNKGTEQPYTGEYDKNKQAGTYHCAACHLAVFSSKAKFDSGTGWPSFFQTIYKENVLEEEDKSLGEVRTEVLCRRCGGHLGHVFDDGPEPTGLRYCINSAALKFKKK